MAKKDKNMASLVKKSFKKLAKEVALLTLDVSYKAQTGHIGSALSVSDLLTVLYFDFLRIKKQSLRSKTRDRFILSKGHAAAALYSVLYKKKILTKQMLYSFGQNTQGLCEHPVLGDPGIEMSSGSLGHGIGFGIGVALGQKKLNQNAKTVVLISDGECGEGSIWEAALLAPRLKLNNLIVIVDYNKWQCFGKSDEISNLEPLTIKWKAFGWNVLEVNGHNLLNISHVFQKANKEKKKPTVIVAHTISGNGILSIKDKLIGHYKIFTEEEYLQAKKELEVRYKI